MAGGRAAGRWLVSRAALCIFGLRALREGRGEGGCLVVCVHACGMRSVRRRGRGAEREKRAGHSIRGCGLGVRYECVEADVLRGLRGFPGGCVQEVACRERRAPSGGAHRVCAPHFDASMSFDVQAPPSSSPGPLRGIDSFPSFRAVIATDSASHCATIYFFAYANVPLVLSPGRDPGGGGARSA